MNTRKQNSANHDPHSVPEYVRRSEINGRYKDLLRKSSQEVLRRTGYMEMALENPVTGLPNRRAYDMAMLDVIAGAEHGNSKDIAVAIIDLDKFKRVNDTLGHYKGDDMMRAYGRRLQEAVRPDDTVFHFGGDEFAVILRGLDHREDREEVPIADLPGRLTERFRFEAVQAAADIHVPKNLGTSASVGIAFYQPGDNPLTITNRADVVMFVDKSRNPPSR